jgi:hypothetical protein
MFVWLSSAVGQTVTWQALPFPITSNWPGPTGQLASITSTGIVLQGQPVRTVESFAAPFTINCDFELASRFTDDGAFTLYLLQPGQPTNTDPTVGLALQIIYSNTGAFGSVDRLEIVQLGGQGLWSNLTFHVVGGTTYHLTLQVLQTGGLNLDIDGTPYPISGNVAYGYADAQIQLGGWQPNDTWTASHFTLVPEPSAALLLTASLAGLAALIRRRR